MASRDESGMTLPAEDPDKDLQLYESDASTLDHPEDRPSADQIDAEAGIRDEKLELTSSKASVNNVASIPNGGLRAWLQTVGVFFIFLNTWGILNTFGAYQTYYETGDLFNESSSTISWLGSLQSFLLLLVGTLTGPIYDAGYIYHLLWTGSFLVIFGQMMLSLCKTYWQALLAQAVCIGVGCGCLFIPGVAMLSTYFNTKLALAVGVAASGSSMGGVIYPIVFHRLQPQIGFGWTTRVLGFIMLGTQVIPLSVLKVRVIPAKKRKLVDWSALREAPYVLFIIGAMVTFMGIYGPFFYITYYAVTTKITGGSLGFYLLSILNAASVFGRILPNFVADEVGPFNVIVPCAVVAGALTLGLIGTHSAGGIVAIAALYGFFSGSFVSLPPTCFVRLSPDRGIIGTRMGMGFAIIAIGGLIGTPISGAILNSSGWAAMWAFSGAASVGGGLIMFLSRMAQAEWKLARKV